MAPRGETATGRSTRVVLFTGKGGVGKTTVAAATAIRAAAGSPTTGARRTLVVSTDPAHSLADSFGVPVGSGPTEIGTGLFAQQVDAQDRMEAAWGDIQKWLVEVFDWAGVEGVEAEELSLLPGLEELFALVDIATHARSGAWDALIVDCAPTAETIRLLSLPDVLSWYMDRLFPVTRRVNRLLGPVLSRMSQLPMADDAVFSATKRLYAQLDGVKELLADRSRSSVRLVVNPERMVVAEARRTFTYLSLFGYRVDAVVANRLLPDEIADPWFDRWRAVHAEQLASIEQGFAPLPILRSFLADSEVVGVERLSALAAALYGDTDPLAMLHDGEPMAIEREPNGCRVLRIDLPFVASDEVEVSRVDDDLHVRVGPYRRAIVLPDSLRHRRVEDASVRDGALRVTFSVGGGPRAGRDDSASRRDHI